MTKKEQLRYLSMLPKVLEALAELADEADSIRALTERIGVRTSSGTNGPPAAPLFRDGPGDIPTMRPARSLPAAQRIAIEEGFLPDAGLRAAKLEQFRRDDQADDDEATAAPPPIRESITTLSGDYDPAVDGEA